MDEKTKKKLGILLITAIAVSILSILILASVPPVSRDALTHHLFVPKLYVEQGKIYEISDIKFSYYPMNLELLYTVSLYFGNDILPKYIHFIFSLLTAFLIFIYLKKQINTIYALTGFLFFLTIPIIIKLSITAYVDLGLVFFSTSTLLLVLKWLSSEYKVRFLVLAGICCGLAAGTKYNGLINLLFFALLIPILYTRSQVSVDKGVNAKGVGFSLLFILSAFMVLSPWLIRNYAWTGNPIYPLYNDLFQHGKAYRVEKAGADENEFTSNIKESSSSEKNVFVNRKILYKENWWQTVLLPIRYFFEGQDGNPQYFDGKLTPFLFLLPFFAFFREQKRKDVKLELKVLIIYSVLLFLFTFFQGVLRIRYITSIIPALVILSMFGLQNILSIIVEKIGIYRSKETMIMALSIPVAMLCYNGVYIVKQFDIVQPFSYLLGEVNRDEYISHYYPEYPLINYINKKLPDTTKVLCFFLGNRGYYMDFRPIFDKPTRTGTFSIILSGATKGVDIKNELDKQDIDYILLRNDLTKIWWKRLEKQKRTIVTFFFSENTQVLLNNGQYTFLKIK